MPQKAIIIGPAWPLRGGLASFDERLAREFSHQGFETIIYTFSLQYPSILFPGKTQFSEEPKPNDLVIKACINSINPFNWIQVGNQIAKEQPSIVVVRFWLPFMGPCLGTMLHLIRKLHQVKIICIADNIIPHEKRLGDLLFTKYFLSSVDAFITMSDQVSEDLKTFTQKKHKQVVHPLYDNFGDPISKELARGKLQIPLNEKIILFFGFIRKYKGLDMLLEAMKDIRIQQLDIKLLVAGEFYEKREIYDTLIQQLDISHQLYLHTDFIADSEVGVYLSAADFVIQPYRNATQSGVTPLAYHFDKPMLVTNVGGLPQMVPNGKVGVVTEPNPNSIAEGILALYELGEPYFLPHLREEKKKYSWENFVKAILSL